MEYKGKYFTIEKSRVFNGEDVNVLEIVSKKRCNRGCCFLCGRPLKRHWWTVQTTGDDLEICDVGPECVKRLT